MVVTVVLMVSCRRRS